MPSEDPMRQTVCPSHAELVAFREGTLPPERVSEIVLHLSNCRKCEAAYQLVTEENELAAETLQALLKETGPESFQDQPDSPRRKVATKAGPGTPPRAWDDAAPSSPPARPEPASEAPTRLGPYEVKEKIGGGGMGTVYRAFHVNLKKWVALKVVRSDRLGDPQVLIRFQREMEAVGRLDHPNIVRATDAGEEGGIHFLVMEWVDGTDLANLVRCCGPLPVAEACELARQAALALQCAPPPRVGPPRRQAFQFALLSQQGDSKTPRPRSGPSGRRAGRLRRTDGAWPDDGDGGLHGSRAVGGQSHRRYSGGPV